MSYRIERISESRLEDLVFLFKTVHGRNVPLNYFKKKYDTSWTGKSYIGFFAYDEKNLPVASYSVTPCFLQFRDRKYLVAQAVDATTHPDHRKKGLFVTLAKKTHDLAREEGIQYVFSFPNDNSYHGFTQRLNFMHLEDAPGYNLKVSALPLLKASHKFGFFSPIYSFFLKSILSLLQEKNAIPNSVVNQEFGGIEHDASFFEYKTYEESYRIRFGEYKVWFKLGDGMLVGDVSRFNKNSWEQFISKLKRICCILGIHQIRLMASPGTFLDVLLRDRYPAILGFHVCYLDLGLPPEIPPQKIKFLAGDSDTF